MDGWRPDQHEWTARSGVRVTSTVARPKPTVADRTPTHLVWSYLSWATWILADYGVWGPRRLFHRIGWGPSTAAAEARQRERAGK